MTKKKRAHRATRHPRAAAKPDAAHDVAPALRNAATPDQMAALFGCTTRQIELLAKEGIVVRIGRGQYDFAKSTTNYVAHLRKQAAGRAGVDPDSDTASANRERAIEQTLLARTKRLALEGQLIDIGKARDVLDRIVRGVRQFVLGLPNSIAHEVPTLTPHDIVAIKRICTDGLQDAATGNGFDLTNLEGGEASDDVSGDRAGEAGAGAAGAAAANQAVGVVRA